MLKNVKDLNYGDRIRISDHELIDENDPSKGYKEKAEVRDYIVTNVQSVIQSAYPNCIFGTDLANGELTAFDFGDEPVEVFVLE